MLSLKIVWADLETVMKDVAADILAMHIHMGPGRESHSQLLTG